MAIEEAKKRELVQGITAILRQSSLAGVINTQHLAMAFDMVLDNVDPGQPIELESLYTWLKSQNAPEKDALELCVVLKLREEKLGVVFTPPPKAQYLDQTVIDALAERFREKAEKNQAYKKAPEPDRPLPGEVPRAWAPKKGAPTGKRAYLTYIMLFVVIVCGVGYWSWRVGTRGPRMEDLAEWKPDSTGLKCQKVTSNKNLAICRMTAATFDAEPIEAQRARAEVTKKRLNRELGVQLLYVNVDGKTRIRM